MNDIIKPYTINSRKRIVLLEREHRRLWRWTATTETDYTSNSDSCLMIVPIELYESGYAMTKRGAIRRGVKAHIEKPKPICERIELP